MSPSVSKLKLDPSLCAVSLNCCCLVASLSSLCSSLAPFSKCASVDVRRHINMLGGQSRKLFQKSGSSIFTVKTTIYQLYSTLFCQKWGLVQVKCARLTIRKHKYLYMLIWGSNFRIRAPFCSSYKEVLPLLCLPVIRSLRLSCLWLASEYPQPISICHSPAHNDTKEPRK